MLSIVYGKPFVTPLNKPFFHYTFFCFARSKFISQLTIQTAFQTALQLDMRCAMQTKSSVYLTFNQPHLVLLQTAGSRWVSLSDNHRTRSSRGLLVLRSPRALSVHEDLEQSKSQHVHDQRCSIKNNFTFKIDQA